MAAIGGNVRRDGTIPPHRTQSLGCTWQRIVAIPDVDLSGYFRQSRDEAGLQTLLVFARESGDDYARYRQLYGDLVDAVQVGNEPDQTSASSWTMTPDEFAALGRRARAALPTKPIVAAGLASGQPDWLNGVDLGWADAIAIHPYTRNAQEIPMLVDAYKRFGKPILITEWGIPDGWTREVDEIAAVVSWAAATSLVEVFFYFAVHDDVPGFGLLRLDGGEKPKADVFRTAARGAVHSLWPTIAAPDVREYARGRARLYGWSDPEMFVRQIQRESGFNPNAHNDTSGADGIAQIVVRWHPTMAGRTRDPYASLDYAARWGAELYARYGSWAKALAAYNWGPGNVDAWDGRRETLPAETRLYLDIILGSDWDASANPVKVRYNPNEPVHPQEHSYDCSQDSLEWALWAYGRRTSDEWLERTMIDEGVMSITQGLLDQSGAGLAAFVRRQYGELGYTANHDPGSSPGRTVLTFDDVATEIGPYPMLMGGRVWNHWTGVRAYDRTRDVLLLANPSNGLMGVSQEMNRAQYAQLGPFSMVRIIHRDVLTVPPPGPPAPDPRIATLRESLLPAARERIDAAIRLVSSS